MHRLFFALAPDPQVHARLVQAAQSLPDAGGRRTPPEQLHLTLAFLGDADPARALQAGARAAATNAAFDFALDEVDSFHGGTWILRAPAAPFAALTQSLLRELRALGLHAKDEGRDFIPHVTLLRRATGRLARAAIDPIAWHADVVRLYDSDLRSGSYIVLGEWPLTPEAVR